MIRLEEVSKSFGPNVVLDRVSLAIERGETLFVVGPSGTGKSVMLKHMIRLLTPDAGRVVVGDDVISEATGGELARIRDRFGVLFQSGALMQWLSVFENVALPLRERTEMAESEICERAGVCLELVGLAEHGEKYPDEISGGMRKRVGLARALVLKPEILLYDEPTSGLDPVSARAIDALIDDTRRKLGVTSVVVTHDLHSALSVATRIAMLTKGRIIELATPQEFIRSRRPEVMEFLESQYITREGVWERGMA